MAEIPKIVLPHGGYKKLIVYRKSDVIYQDTVAFCRRFLPTRGDRFGNYERRLPAGNYKECDIDTKGMPRGAKRLVFTVRGERIYYTHDHYKTFEGIKEKSK